MQVEVDVKCMQANFDGHGLFIYGDLVPSSLPSKTAKFPFRPWTIVHGGQKIESAQKIWQVEDVKCMQANFGGHGLSGFGDLVPSSLPSKTDKFPFQPWTSPWGSKNRIGSKNSCT